MINASTSTRSVRAVTVLTRQVHAAAASRTSARSTRSAGAHAPHAGCPAPRGCESGGMCGRYASTRTPQELAPLFQVPDVPAKETLAPNWNVAPTNDVWAVLERSPRGEEDSDKAQRELRPLRWGLVPSWATA
ncbi:SOS response-associated peptidase family protein [Streptomyces canus]